MEHIDIKEIILEQFEHDSFCKYDIVIRHMFVTEYFHQGKPEDFSHKLYSLLAKASDTKDRTKRFIRLIESFEEKGFDSSYPLEISKDYHVCGGTHRLALCLYMSINQIPFVSNESCKRKKRRFNKKWLKKNGFSKHMKTIEFVKNLMLRKIGIINGKDSS